MRWGGARGGVLRIRFLREFLYWPYPTTNRPPPPMRLLAVCLIALLSLSCTSGSDVLPDRAFLGGVVWTGDPDRPSATAFAVRDDRIVAVGTDDEIRELGASETIDLEGRFVIPGFIDNHTHFLTGGAALASVDLRDAATPEEFTARIAEFAGSIPAGRWIREGNWDHEMWGGELPRHDWIDDATPDNPVFVSRLDGHMALVNGQVLEMAGINADTPDPDGGTIVRDPQTGEPTGVLKDEAMSLAYAVMPEVSQQERLEMLERATEHALLLGVTQIHDVGGSGGWNDLETFEAARDAGNLGLRVYSFVPISTWERMAERVETQGRGDDWLRWGGLKGFVDGSLGSTTAWFYDPYEDEPGTSGLMVTDTTSLAADIHGADAAGLQLAIHAIGDRANDWLLDTFEAAAEANGPRDRRPSIEHAQHLTREAIERFASLGVVPSMQPFHAIDDGRWAEKRIGPDRIRTTYAFRSLLDAGARLTFGSDWTVAPVDPLQGIYAAVTRRTTDGANPDGWVPEQKITVEEALRAYTVTNAWAGNQEDRLGMIREGYLADFVVLSENLLDIDPTRIPEVRVLRTVIDGTDRFTAE